MSIFPGMIKFRNAANKQLTFRQGQEQTVDITVALPDALPTTPKLWQIEPSGQISFVDPPTSGLSPEQLASINAAIAVKEDAGIATGLLENHALAPNPHPQYLTTLPSHDHTIASVTGLIDALDSKAAVNHTHPSYSEWQSVVVWTGLPSFSGLGTILELSKLGSLYRLKGSIVCSTAYTANTVIAADLPYTGLLPSVVRQCRVRNFVSNAVIDCLIALAVPSAGSAFNRLQLSFGSSIALNARILILNEFFLL